MSVSVVDCFFHVIYLLGYLFAYFHLVPDTVWKIRRIFMPGMMFSSYRENFASLEAGSLDHLIHCQEGRCLEAGRGCVGPVRVSPSGQCGHWGLRNSSFSSTPGLNPSNVSSTPNTHTQLWQLKRFPQVNEMLAWRQTTLFESYWSHLGRLWSPVFIPMALWSCQKINSFQVDFCQQ